MDKTKVKICGLSRKEDIAYVNELKPDFIGFVFAKSRRQVTREKAGELKALLDPKIKAVGVFVQEEVVQVARVANSGSIDLIQLHGDESPAFCSMLRKLTLVPIIKVVRVAKEEDLELEKLKAYECDYFLFDTLTSTNYGGEGKTFNWRLLEGKQIPKPYFIAGGLNAANVQEVISSLHPFAVDVSSGVETEGFKDKEKIRKFMTKTTKGDR